MKLKFKLTRHTTASELAHLGQFITGLAFDRGAHLTPPADCEPLTGYAPVEDAADPTPAETAHVAGNEPPKRRRRSKAEIEAAAAAEEKAQATYDQARNQPDPEPEVNQAPAPLADSPAPTPAAPQQDTPPSETASIAPASASPSEGGKDYTEAEVQDLAGKVARGVGPEVVKQKIAELGAARIAELTQEQRNALGEFLKTKLA
jgi:hypothetical protein